MTQDEIIELAKEAGFESFYWRALDPSGNLYPIITKFAELIQSYARLSQQVLDSVLAEREACAKICLDHSAEFNDTFPLVRASNHILARNERE